MSKRVFLKPAPGIKVRRPLDGVHIADDGEEVVLDAYWRRRIADGSVTITRKPAPAKPASKKADASEV